MTLENLYTQFIVKGNENFKDKTRKIQVDCSYAIRLENGLVRLSLLK
ncbi:hypothetical protein [Helicobacter enhydrae]|nr:hypothetical protein [Helicobacter enhydrae]